MTVFWIHREKHERKVLVTCTGWAGGGCCQQCVPQLPYCILGTLKDRGTLIYCESLFNVNDWRSNVIVGGPRRHFVAVFTPTAISKSGLEAFLNQRTVRRASGEPASGASKACSSGQLDLGRLGQPLRTQLISNRENEKLVLRGQETESKAQVSSFLLFSWPLKLFFLICRPDSH